MNSSNVRTGREQEPWITIPTHDGEVIEAMITVASPKKLIVRKRDHKSKSAFPTQRDRINSICMYLEQDTISFSGHLKAVSASQCEVIIDAMTDSDRLRYDKFLLSRLDRQYELSRKVEELALEEIQQLNKELSLSLKVEEAALAEAQKVNEELRQAQDELLTSRNQLKAILDGITAGIYLIDDSFKLLAMNKRQMEWLGLSEQIKSRTSCCFELFFHRTSPCDFCPAVHTFKTGEQSRNETIFKNDGDVTHFEFSSFPIKDEQKGTVSQVVQYMEDVTTRREMEEQLFQTEKMASLGTMTAGIAHELKNPLSSISMTIQLIKRKDSVGEKTLKRIRKIEAQLNKAGKILSDIKAFSRKERLAFSSIDIAHHIPRLLDQLKELGTVKNIEVISDFQATKSVMVEPDQLDQVLINLMNNAVDAMEHSVEKKLTIKTGMADENTVIISISDTGEGIPKEIVKKIFDPFFTTKPPGKGTGLGLALCYKIIERHRGTIKVESTPGVGTSFHIMLPHVNSNLN